MNIPMSWLKDFVDIDDSLQEFEHKMTMSGSKVESITSIGKDISNVVLGKVTSIEKHPDADKLVVCQVDIGKDAVQIVTGAKNVFEGALVPVALHGATLAGGLKIKNSKLRGVPSQGMMCSIEELGYTRADYPESPEDGIYIFNDTYQLGADVCEILELKEDVIEFELTSNRPDCYSVVGMAREVAATFSRRLKLKEINLLEKGDGSSQDIINVDIQNKDVCSRYIARVIKNVKVAPSPQWMRHRLTTSGIRPINNIVDISNYVMLEFGQPVHAFDMDSIDSNKIIVRNAKEGEVITTLDNVTRQLNNQALVIADSNKPLAIAGIMGGVNSGVTEKTTTVIFESANFKGINIRLTSKALGLRTDSSTKYEKGLDPNISLDVINRCMELVEILGCGEVVKNYVDVYPEVVQGNSVKYSTERINKLLGTNISNSEIEEILGRLCIKAKDGIANIPTYRSDIECEADIAEEVIRIYGFDKIQPKLTASVATVGKKNYTQEIEDIIKDTATSLGLYEIINYSFESPKVFEKLNISKESNLRNTVNIKNPLGEDFSIMKTNTLHGMLQTLSLNFNRRNEEASLFEVSKVYLPKSLPLKELPEENMTLTIGMYSRGNTKYDFYYIKGMVEEIFKSVGMEKRVEYISSSNYSFMHPGRTASININQINCGFIGEVHPIVQENYEIQSKVYTAVINLELIYKEANLNKNYKPLPKYPAVTRDIAILIKDEINVKEIEKVIREKGSKILEEIKLFDVYKGNQIKEGYKSVAYSITFRDTEKTLTDVEVNAVMDKVLKNLEDKLEVSLRKS